jgi:hypothetical protein
MPMTKTDLENYNWTFQRLKEENTKSVTDDRIQEIMSLLHRHEITIQRLYTNECNYGLTDKEKRKLGSSKKRVQNLAEELGLKVGFNSDPRGPAIKLYLPSGRYNSMDGETWRILW